MSSDTSAPSAPAVPYAAGARSATLADGYPVLPAQHGMVLNTLRFPGNGVDLLQITLDWAEPLAPVPFEQAWREVVRRNPVLRTRFRLDAERSMVQLVDPVAVLDLAWRHLPAAPVDGPDPAFESWLVADRRAGFHLDRAPLLRLTVLRRGDDPAARRAVLTFHHALLDGRSMRLLVEEVSAEYRARLTGQQFEPPPRPAFADYVRWWQDSAEPAEREFWAPYLADPVQLRPLPGHLPDTRYAESGEPAEPAVPAEPARAELALSRAESDLLRAAARRAGLSASTLLSAAWALLRARYGGGSDVVFAVTRSCRPRSIAGSAELLGLLINTVPLRVRIDPGWSVGQLLAAVDAQVRAIRAHQRTPLASILGWAGLPADGAPLDSLLMYDRARLRHELPVGEHLPIDCRVDRLPSYPLTICGYDEPEFQLAMLWDRRRFVDAAPVRMLGQLRATLLELAGAVGTSSVGAVGTSSAGIPLAGLRLGAEEEAGVRTDWQSDPTGYPREATVPQLFAEQVARQPAALALRWSGGCWSYAELDRHSATVAASLRRLGVGLDQPVAVALPRGPELIAVLLGILRAGGAYLPIDPASPPARTAAMLRGVGLLVTGAASTGARSTGARSTGAGSTDAASTGVGSTDSIPGPRIIEVGDLLNDKAEAPPGPGAELFDAGPAAHPDSLAYVSFTSGSTGVPKGVAVPHRAVARLISQPTFATLGPGQRVLQLAPVAFDASTLEIWGALLTGATLVLAPPGPLGLTELADLLRGSDATLAWLTAGLFHQLVEADVHALAGIEQLLAGGDVLDPAAVRAVLAVRAGKPVVNGYGPTENTTFTSCQVLTDPAEVTGPVPIGRPIQQTRVHVLDEQLRPVPIGVAGELYAGGDGLARGYAGNPAATARAFVPDPFGSGGRLYRTGDLARWRADGVLEFLGRADEQVKIRGFRVEPGEVEAVLRGAPGVRQAVVTVRGDGAQRHLAGYVLPAEGAEPDQLRPAVLHDYLRQRLPEYLVPAGYAVLDRFPLTTNGKVDRAGLPEPVRPGREAGAPPRGETERGLAEVWLRLLPDGVRDVGDDIRAGDGVGGVGGDGGVGGVFEEPAWIGRQASFFALGGNSLSAARLMFRIREVFGVELPMGEFYREPTLAAAAAAIDAARAASTGGIGRRDRGAYRVSAPAAGDVPAASASIATAPAVPAAGIGRRDRSAYRVGPNSAAPTRTEFPTRTPPPTAEPPTRTASPIAEPPAATPPATHLIGLTEHWSLWRTVCLRAAGLPVHLLSALGDPELAARADAVRLATEAGNSPAGKAEAKAEAEAGYAAEFPAAVARLSRALHRAAGLPALREAVAWQNRHALSTGIDAVLRHGPAPASRNTKHRQHEALVASYLQRYCAKNDTIGFFGPVSWSELHEGAGIRISHAAPTAGVTERVTYLEGWAVRAVLARHTEALRPWLVPRRMPFVAVADNQLLLPLAPPVPLAPAEAAVLAACDGVRTATDLAALVVADPAAGLADQDGVFAILARLADSHRVAWQVDIAPQDIRPERSALALLATVPDPDVREPAEAALAEVSAARDRLAAAAGDPDRVATAMAELESTFARVAETSPTRRAGALYAGRTLAYEECLRADTVRLGVDALAGVSTALGLVLDSARWFTASGGARYAEHFRQVYQQRAAVLGSAAVPFADFWLLANDVLFEQPPSLIEPVLAQLQQRWSAILGLPTGQRRLRLRSAELRDAVAEAFGEQPRSWPMAVHHSPDLLIAGSEAAGGGPFEWVLGELHPSIVTTRYATWLRFHPDPAAVRAGLRADLGGPTVFVAETAEEGGVSARLSNVLDSEGDRRLVFAHDSAGYPPERSLVVGDCEVIDSPTGLRVRRRDGSLELDLLEVVGDLLSAVLAQTFQPVPRTPVPGSATLAHAPRISIDELVVSRESWSLPAAEPGFAAIADERTRYARARAWAARHGLPRHVFLRFTGERKPIYADLTSLASVDLIARSLRRAERVAGPAATVTVAEMLPTPEQAWLTDAQGQRYTAELRMVAVDRKG